jgi:hypothetical protein
MSIKARAIPCFTERRNFSRSASSGSVSIPAIKSNGDRACESAARLALNITEVISAALNLWCRRWIARLSSSASNSASVSPSNSALVNPYSRRHSAHMSVQVRGASSRSWPRPRRLGLCPFAPPLHTAPWCEES